MPQRSGTGAVTLLDVAREAGVSLATASRALNGSTRHVRSDLAEKVAAAAERLHYSANAQAQAMATGRSNVVGLILGDVADPYFSSIAAGAIRAAEERGAVVTIGCTFGRPERELDYVSTLRGQRARAAVLVGSRVTDSTLLDRLDAELGSFARGGGRVAMVSQRRLPYDTVAVENRAGARALAERLAGLGYRRFAVLAGPTNLVTARDRLAGFRQGLARSGVELSGDDVVHGPFTRDGGHEAALEVLARSSDVDCVFAVNDVMAVGAMAALRGHGVGLPESMGVAGFDDIATLRDVTPSLTTVRLPLESLGADAVDLVLQPAPAAPRMTRVRGEVVVRESTPGPNRDPGRDN